MMTLEEIQQFFRYSDDVDREKLREWLHPDLLLTAINVGLEKPLNLEEYLDFIERMKTYHADRGEVTKHIPTNVLIEGDFIAISGHVLHSYPDKADEYSTYFDFWKLRDGKIVEYSIAHDL
ncbi:hypothetical protein L288_08685 [Sphingobium quisquiliarum P25]|uniref:SnoaL-like domain-containing protein n=1 Tax=Sphingobium quisquiliarum P25 TaxID=1329909 RepID=T0I8S6_9SPHN|nr:nuclear transport factor 2 family protein [Sphingobium quisquiliarum]EQB08090.1 hypothetical protein L288_08685 [Sphingobium quisquiliarum P25]